MNIHTARNWISISILTFFISNTGFSQEFADPPVIAKFRSYSARAFQEKLFLHTDKDFYTAGEILWFKIYSVDGTFHKPSEVSKISYIEILNERNEPVLQNMVSLVPGKNNGSFYLPTSFNTGYYTIRAYTNWMKNFDAAYFFEKKITIVNTLKVSPPVATQDVETNPVIRFFPEGGNLVSDINSTVGFTVTDINGGINNCHGFIINKNNDTIVSFSPSKFGIGRFEMTPLEGGNYKAVMILSNGKQVLADLPEIYNNGYVMRVKDNGQDQFEVIVYRKRAQAPVNEQMLLAVHNKQVLKYAGRNIFNGIDSTIFVIDKKRLGQGIIHFTVFNSSDKPVCERLCFIKPTLNALSTVKTQKAEYGNREKINVAIQVPGNSLYDLSASVFQLDTFQQQDQVNVISYLWLCSDLPASIESPGYYFSADAGSTRAADNLMLTHGWRKFNWENILSNDSSSFIKYLPETRGHLVSGNMKDPKTKAGANNALSLLSISGHPFGFYAAETNSEGFVQFEVKNFYGNHQLTAVPGNERDSFYKVEIIKPFAQSSTYRKYVPLIFTEQYQELLLQKSIGMQVQNIYSGDSSRTFTEPTVRDTFPFYGLGETNYALDQYKRFTTMEEVLREYVAGVNVIVRGGTQLLKVFNPYMKNFHSESPLVMIDGVPLANPHAIFSYDPLKAKKLDLVLNRYVFGNTLFSGIISYSTYNGAFDAFELDPEIVGVDYNGLQLQREFYSPVYETKEQIDSRLPDLRNTLLWKPDILIGNEGKASLQFYSSDRSGKYVLVLQGINNNGEPVYSFTTFSVK